MTIADPPPPRMDREEKPLILFLVHWPVHSGFAVLSQGRECCRRDYHTATSFTQEGQCGLAELTAVLGTVCAACALGYTLRTRSEAWFLPAGYLKKRRCLSLIHI